jgi:hypothetical protein
MPPSQADKDQARRLLKGRTLDEALQHPDAARIRDEAFQLLRADYHRSRNAVREVIEKLASG